MSICMTTRTSLVVIGAAMLTGELHAEPGKIADGASGAAISSLEKRVQSALGTRVGSPEFDLDADLNRDGVINVLDVALLRGIAPARDNIVKPGLPPRAIAGPVERIIVEPSVLRTIPGGTVTVRFLLRDNGTELLGYSLDIEVIPGVGFVGEVSVNIPASSFTEQNLIPEELRDPLFSTFIDTADGGVFVNAITIDNSTVLSKDGVRDVFAEVVMNVSDDACGSFSIQLGLATALSDGNAFPVPFSYAPPTVAPAGPTGDPRLANAGNGTKNRILSFQETNAGRQTAMRVRFDDLPVPFDALNGTVMWVGGTQEFCENSGQTQPPPEGCGLAPGQPSSTLFVATLVCDPVYRDWSGFGTVHVHHQDVVPDGFYEIQAIDQHCDLGMEQHFSDALVIETSIWGDVGGICAPQPCEPLPPNGSIDITEDVTLILDKFRNLETGLAKERADLEPEVLDFLINISDVTFCLEAFRSEAYPFDPDLDPCGQE